MYGILCIGCWYESVFVLPFCCLFLFFLLVLKSLRMMFISVAEVFSGGVLWKWLVCEIVSWVSWKEPAIVRISSDHCLLTHSALTFPIVNVRYTTVSYEHSGSGIGNFNSFVLTGNSSSRETKRQTENDGKTTLKSGLALNGISYYGKLRTARSGGSWLYKSTVVPQRSARPRDR